jgi:hypothetical protein
MPARSAGNFPSARTAYTGTNGHGWLAWNLFLAWIPFALALVLYERARAGAPLRVLVPLGCSARLLSERALPRHRPEVRRRRRPHPCALRRAAVLGRRVDGAATRADLALPRAHDGATVCRHSERLGAGRRSAHTQLVRDLPRPVQRWNSWDVVANPVPLGAQLLQGLAHPLDYSRPSPSPCCSPRSC